MHTITLNIGGTLVKREVSSPADYFRENAGIVNRFKAPGYGRIMSAEQIDRRAEKSRNQKARQLARNAADNAAKKSKKKG